MIFCRIRTAALRCCLAMYRAKEEGRNRIALFEDPAEGQAERRGSEPFPPGAEEVAQLAAILDDRRHRTPWLGRLGWDSSVLG